MIYPHSVFDIENFCKLFKVPCNVERLFHHYVQTLVDAGDDKLLSQLELYNEREEVVENMYQDKKSFFNLVQENLKETEASKCFNRWNGDQLFYGTKYRETKMNHYKEASNEGKLFISIDMVTANYQTLKLFDRGHNQLGDSWEDYIRALGVPEVYIASKNFRQYVFEQSMPMRTHKFQGQIMSDVLHVIDGILPGFVDDHIVLRSPDEVVFAVSPEFRLTYNYKRLCNIEDLYYMSHDRRIKFRITNYWNTIIFGDKQFRTMLDDNFQPIKRILKHIPATLYYMYLRRYVMEAPDNQLDRYFMQDGHEAMWTFLLK